MRYDSDKKAVRAEKYPIFDVPKILPLYQLRGPDYSQHVAVLSLVALPVLWGDDEKWIRGKVS